MFSPKALREPQQQQRRGEPPPRSPKTPPGSPKTHPHPGSPPQGAPQNPLDLLTAPPTPQGATTHVHRPPTPPSPPQPLTDPQNASETPPPPPPSPSRSRQILPRTPPAGSAAYTEFLRAQPLLQRLQSPSEISSGFGLQPRSRPDRIPTPPLHPHGGGGRERPPQSQHAPRGGAELPGLTPAGSRKG